MKNDIVKSDGFMPALTIADAVTRYNAVIEFTKTVMKADKDFGKVPGTDKPTLLKPGAEKLCSLFGLAPRFKIIDKIVDFERGLFYFQYECELYRGEQFIASANGSCNSREKKYRYRNIAENKATAEEKASAIRTETKSGKYGTYKVYVIENAEPYDLLNTIDKMAQKRALVAATLIAANASEFFTQDVEDMQIIDGYAVEDEQPKNTKTQKQEQPAEGKPEMSEEEKRAWITAAWKKLVERANKVAVPAPPMQEGWSIDEMKAHYSEVKGFVEQAEDQAEAA